MVKRNYLSKTLREKYFSGSGLAEIDQKVLARTDNNIQGDKMEKWKQSGKICKQLLQKFSYRTNIGLSLKWR